jgi:hypothetical protein
MGKVESPMILYLGYKTLNMKSGNISTLEIFLALSITTAKNFKAPQN